MPEGLEQIAAKTTSIDKYMYLSNLRNTNTDLFYRLLIDNMRVSVHPPCHSLPRVGSSDNNCVLDPSDAADGFYFDPWLQQLDRSEANTSAGFIRKSHRWSTRPLSEKRVKNGLISTHSQKVRAPWSYERQTTWSPCSCRFWTAKLDTDTNVDNRLV